MFALDHCGACITKTITMVSGYLSVLLMTPTFLEGFAREKSEKSVNFWAKRDFNFASGTDMSTFHLDTATNPPHARLQCSVTASLQVIDASCRFPCIDT